MDFPALHYQANGKDFYLGLIPADSLIQNYDIDAHSLDNPQGYQRYSKLIRSKRFANFVNKYGGFFHQTVLANVRDPGSLRFASLGESNEGIVTLDGKLFIVDGQHRVGGIRSLLEGEDGKKFSHFPVPVLIMVGAQQQEEAFHFFLVNRTQEGVKMDLGDVLLAKVIPKERLTPEFEKDVLGSKEKIPLTQKAIQLAEEMNTNPDSIWKDRISYAQESVGQERSITQRGFTQSVKEILTNETITAMFDQIPDDLVDPLIDYWKAIAELCPQATGKNFKDYVLMKTTGAYIMHKLFPQIVAKLGYAMHQRKMKQILERIQEMRDDDWTNDGDIGTGAGYKLYDRWVKRFIKQIQAKD